MARIWMGVLMALGAAGLAWGQEGGEKRKEAAAGQGPMLKVSDVDSNGDGWISAAELKAALGKLGGGEKEGVKKVRRPEGEGDGVKKVRPEGAREGDPVKKPLRPEGEKPRKDGEREGGEKGGDREREK